MSDDDLCPYRIEGDLVVPTDYSRGPWFADQQHGGAVLGLLARFLDRVPSPQPMRYTRITVDLSRPVPVEPCTLVTRALRDGRRVQSIEALLSVGGTVVSRAVGTRIRIQPGLVPADKVAPSFPEDVLPPFDPTLGGYGGGDGGRMYHDTLEVHAAPRLDCLGGVGWFRLRGRFVAGEEPSALVRLAAVADFVTSSAMRLGPDWISINPEVSLQIEREPDGEWIGIASTVRLDDDGIGVSEAVVYDRTRRIGRTSKSVLNMPR